MPRPAELGPEEARRTARDLAASGARVVSLTGGEPTLRPDWVALVAELAAGGVAPVLMTNGLALDRPTARAARAAGLAGAWVSLDGPPRVHDRIRQRPWAFRRAVAAACALREEGIPVGFLTTILRPNVTALDALAAVVQASGLMSWKVRLGVPWRRSPLWLRPDEVPALLRRLLALRQQVPGLELGDRIDASNPHDALRPALPLLAETTVDGEPCRWSTADGPIGLRSDGTVVGGAPPWGLAAGGACPAERRHCA
jgi:MoaA/NifB/PqqE/SkfB family radical SAM enzyme